MSSPDDMMSSMRARLAERTGRDLDGWVRAVQESGIDPLDQNAVRKWLKTEHGLAQNTQWMIAFEAAKAAGWRMPTVEEFLDQQYGGAKAALRPIYDRLAGAALELGDDVSAEGRGGYIPFVRKRQFAAVAAATKTRVDLGLRFTDPPASTRLADAKGFAQATHKVALHSLDEVDAEVLDLLRTAYEQNG